MATKKKAAGGADPRPGETTPSQTPHTEAYERAVESYTAGLHRLHGHDYAGAIEIFKQVETQAHDEPVLAERARLHVRICEEKLAPPPAEPESVEDSYKQAVLLTNQGRADEAIQVVDRALQLDPQSPWLLYTRATAWALKGNAEAAVSDLRQAIAGDPQIRFQAVNDADFEKIREEPAFIDVIEPTPAGA